jgi:aspartyl aminopeptidase
VLTLFDNEEVGSRTVQGAASTIVNELVQRVTGDAKLIEVAKRKSFLVSADMAHAVHPNYSGL